MNHHRVISNLFGVLVLSISIWALVNRDSYGLALTSFYLIAFMLLPGGLLLDALKIIPRNIFEEVTLRLACGLVLLPFVLYPLWRFNLMNYSVAWVLVGIAWTAHRRKNISKNLSTLNFSFVNAVLTVLTLVICVFFSFSHSFYEGHHLAQAMTSRVLVDGFPADNSFVEGVPLAYNFGMHMIMGHFTIFSGLDLHHIVGRLFPVTLTLILLATFTVTVQRLIACKAWITWLLIINTFWVLGYGPINNKLFGAMLVQPNILLLGPLGALIGFLVFVNSLDNTLYKGSASKPAVLCFAIGIFVISFSTTSFRGVTGPILVCSGAFLVFMSFFHASLSAARTLVIPVFALVGWLAASASYLNMFGDFSASSFVQVNTTFDFLGNERYFVARQLLNLGVGAFTAGGVTYLFMAFFQATFLSPALFFGNKGGIGETSWNSLPASTLALIGASIAGVFGTGLTSAGGGSHFSFLHFTNLSMTILAGFGLSLMLKAVSDVAAGQPAYSSALHARAKIVLTCCALLFILVMIEVPLQAHRYGVKKAQDFVKYSLFQRPGINFDYQDSKPVFSHLQARDKVFNLASLSADEFRALSGAHHLNGVALKGYVSGYVLRAESDQLSAILLARMQAADQARSLAEQNIPPFAALEDLSRTFINRDHRYFVLCNADLELSSNPKFVLVEASRKLSLYAWTLD